MAEKLNQDNIRITYTVLHDAPVTEEESVLSDNCGKNWASLMSKVFSNRYLDIVNKVSQFRLVFKEFSTVKRLKVSDLTPILRDNNIIGIVDLISSSFLFDRSPLDLQLFILSGLGVNTDMMIKVLRKLEVNNS